ncbi:MAG: phage tail protein [Rhodocyclaceae bacterium]
MGHELAAYQENGENSPQIAQIEAHLSEHADDTGIHVSWADRVRWNAAVTSGNLSAYATTVAPAFTGAIRNRAPSTGNADFWIQDDMGRNHGNLYWQRSGDAVRLARVESDGNPLQELEVSERGLSFLDKQYSLYWRQVWHDGNRDTSGLDLPGSVKLITGYVPSGWLPLEGQSLSPHDYPALFNRIGSYFGGDGVSAFVIPDLRSKSPASGVNYCIKY